MARRGAGTLGSDDASASGAWRSAAARSRDDADGGRPPEPWAPEEWVPVDVRDEAEEAVERGRTGSRRVGGPEGAPDLSAPLLTELEANVGPARAPKLQKRLQSAARSFEREHFEDARRTLRPLVQEAPGSANGRELYGLTLYRLERWKAAAAQLEAFRQLTGSTEQHPVLADCYRALGRYGEVEQLWDELRQASPGGDLVTEGRIVMAGAVADQGRLEEAIAILGRDWRLPKHPKDHHLRRAYALADLHERAGDVPRARELFGRIQRADARFGDVARRTRALS